MNGAADALEDVKQARSQLIRARERTRRWKDRTWSYVIRETDGTYRIGATVDITKVLREGDTVILTRRGVALAHRLRRLEDEELHNEVEACLAENPASRADG